MIELICQYCNSIFYVTNNLSKQKYCSIVCRGLAGRKRIIRVCRTCKKEFECIPSHSEDGTGIYCSTSCKNTGRKPLPKKCLFCGKEFTSKNRKRKYCSRSCVCKHRSANNVGRICRVCNTKFYVQISRLKKGCGKYCSLTCMGVEKRKDSSYIERRGSKEYHDWKFECLDRDHYKCVLCGATKSKDNIEVHHIMPFAKYVDLRFDVSNGMTVCETCHEWIHSSKHCTC